MINHLEGTEETKTRTVATPLVFYFLYSIYLISNGTSLILPSFLPPFIIINPFSLSLSPSSHSSLPYAPIPATFFPVISRRNSSLIGVRWIFPISDKFPPPRLHLRWRRRKTTTMAVSYHSSSFPDFTIWLCVSFHTLCGCSENPPVSGRIENESFKILFPNGTIQARCVSSFHLP